MDVFIGSCFFIEDINYVVIEKIFLGVFKLWFEIVGLIGNIFFGILFLVDYINNFFLVVFGDFLVFGEDEELDELLWECYFIEINE